MGICHLEAGAGQWYGEQMARGVLGEGRNIDLLQVSYIKKIKTGKFSGPCMIHFQEFPESMGGKLQVILGFSISMGAKVCLVINM